MCVRLFGKAGVVSGERALGAASEPCQSGEACEGHKAGSASKACKGSLDTGSHLRRPLRARHLVLAACVVLAVAALAACAPRSAESNGGASSGGTTTWQADADCSVCHAAVDEGALGAKHSALNAQCTSCHNEADLTKVHAEHGDSGRTPTKLRYTKVTQESCLSSVCHKNQEKVLSQTASVRVVDKEGTSVNPHNLASNESHDALVCASCHTVHANTPTATTATKETCFGCHHQEVFECHTCHA